MLSLLRDRKGLDGQVVLVKEYVYPALHLIGMGVWDEGMGIYIVMGMVLIPIYTRQCISNLWV